jgi:hypothetical protein
MESLIEKIKKLKIFKIADNKWEKTQYKPYTEELIRLSEVIKILEEYETEKLRSEEKRS